MRLRSIAAIVATVALMAIAGYAFRIWHLTYSARDAEMALADIANKVLGEDHRLARNRVRCSEAEIVPKGVGFMGFKATFLCNVETVCGDLTYVVHSAYGGKYVGPDPVADKFAENARPC